MWEELFSMNEMVASQIALFIEKNISSTATWLICMLIVRSMTSS